MHRLTMIPLASIVMIPFSPMIFPVFLFGTTRWCSFCKLVFTESAPWPTTDREKSSSVWRSMLSRFSCGVSSIKLLLVLFVYHWTLCVLWYIKLWLRGWGVGLYSTEVTFLLLIQRPVVRFRHSQKNLFQCCWDLLIVLVRGKWTEAWKCWSNPVLACGKLVLQKTVASDIWLVWTNSLTWIFYS